MQPYEEFLPHDLQQRFERFAESTGSDVQALLIKIIEQGLERAERSTNHQTSEESLYENLSNRGLLGCLESGPADLSCNPKHMEGFGEENADRPNSN